MSFHDQVSRRRFLKSAELLLGAAAVPWSVSRAANAASNVRVAAGTRPQLEQGIQIGDVRAHRAVIWSRSDRPARLMVEYDFNPRFAHPILVRGPFALDTSDYTARVDLTGLPEDSEVFVRMMFEDFTNDSLVSEAMQGHFRTAPRKNRAIRFLWSGDTAGQGWGINPDFGRMKIYETMRQTRPDFFHPL
jgi:alkaline phosphatase D